MTPAQFTREFAEALRKASPSLEVQVVQDLQLKVTSADGIASTSFLDNAYDAYRQNPREKDAVIQRFVSAGLETFAPRRGGIDKSRIVPVVKDRGWLQENRRELIARGAKEAPKHVYEDLNAELIILYAEDSPKSIRYLTPKELEEIKIRKEDLRTLALENLKKILPKIERHGSNGLYILTAGGDYEASLLLFDSIWSGKQMQVQGDIVVAIPTRDLLIVTGSGDKEGIRKAKSMGEKAFKEGSYRLTPKLFIYRDGKFHEFAP